MIGALPASGLQHGDPVLEAQQVSLTDILGTELIIIAMVLIHHGIPKPVRFGLPRIRFWLAQSLFRVLSAPFNSHADRGHRLSHVFGLRRMLKPFAAGVLALRIGSPYRSVLPRLFTCGGLALPEGSL